jgi:internalin A
MDRIGKGAVNGRVFVVLSDKYLKSAYCMHELFDIWRNCREDPETFIGRTRLHVLPSAKIATIVERAQYVIYWQSKFKETDGLVKEHGQFVLSDDDNAEYRLMTRFVNETANVLKLVQDTLASAYIRRVRKTRARLDGDFGFNAALHQSGIGP